MGKWPDKPSLFVGSIVLTVAFDFALHATTGTAALRDAKEEIEPQALGLIDPESI